MVGKYFNYLDLKEYFSYWDVSRFLNLYNISSWKLCHALIYSDLSLHFFYRWLLDPILAKLHSECLIPSYMSCHFLAVLTLLPSPIQPKTCIISFRILSRAKSLLQYSFSFWLLQRAFSAFNLLCMFISKPNAIFLVHVFSTLGRHLAEPAKPTAYQFPLIAPMTLCLQSYI